MKEAKKIDSVRWLCCVVDGDDGLEIFYYPKPVLVLCLCIDLCIYLVSNNGPGNFS